MALKVPFEKFDGLSTEKKRCHKNTKEEETIWLAKGSNPQGEQRPPMSPSP